MKASNTTGFEKLVGMFWMSRLFALAVTGNLKVVQPGFSARFSSSTVGAAEDKESRPSSPRATLGWTGNMFEVLVGGEKISGIIEICESGFERIMLQEVVERASLYV